MPTTIIGEGAPRFVSGIVLRRKVVLLVAVDAGATWVVGFVVANDGSRVGSVLGSMIGVRTGVGVCSEAGDGCSGIGCSLVLIMKDERYFGVVSKMAQASQWDFKLNLTHCCSTIVNLLRF